MMTSSPYDAWGVPPERLSHLADFFPAADLEWRVGPTNRDKTSGIALCYVTNRAVQERFDSVCGLHNWRNEYKPTPNDVTGQSVLCGLSVNVRKPDGSTEWVTKWDGAGNASGEDFAIKGGLSSAMKRAAVQWGVGRYLYSMPSPWVKLDENRRMVHAPRVPPEFLPKGADATEVPRVAHEPDDDSPVAPRPDEMTEEQANQIRTLLEHPAITPEVELKYERWIAKRQLRDMADKAIVQLQGMVEQAIRDEAEKGPGSPPAEPDPKDAAEPVAKPGRKAAPSPAAKAPAKKPAPRRGTPKAPTFEPGSSDELPFR